jgi:hypothetical protein
MVTKNEALETMQDEDRKRRNAQLERLLDKRENRPRGAEARRKRGRPPELEDRRRAVLKMLEEMRRKGRKGLTREEIMSRLGIEKRKPTFYEIIKKPLDASGQIFLDHDKGSDLWYLKRCMGQGRKWTMSRCREFSLLNKAIKQERLDFYIPRREWNDNMVNRALHDPEAERLLGIESSEPRFERHIESATTDEDEDEDLRTTEDVRKSFESKYSDKWEATTSTSGVQVRQSILPLLPDDKDRERGAIYWHIEPLDRKPDGKKRSRKESEEIRERDQPRIKMLLEKCGPMSLSSFMYLIPEAFLLSIGQLDKRYFTGERSLAKMSDKELDMVRRTAFGQSKRLAILYTLDVDKAFKWFTNHCSEGPVQEELRSRFEEIGTGVKAAERWSEKEKKPRIYQQHREPSAKYYPTRKEVSEEEKAAGDRFGEKFSRQDEERARRRLSAERRSRSLSGSKERD